MQKRPEEKFAQRFFAYLLLGITVAALVPLLLLGIYQFIHYDGYWHVFIATQNRWSLFFSEWKGDAHPPLYYLLLRQVAKLGHSHLTYRALSIVPGAAAVYVIGQIARKLCNSPLIALLAAAAYGFSMTMIEIACDVRSYPLALFFILCAFSYFVDFLNAGSCARASRSALTFAVLTTLAILSEYYSVLFLMAAIGVVAIDCLLYAEFRRRLAGWLRHRWPTFLGAICAPFLTIGFLYWAHLRYQPLSFANVVDFYWTPETSRTHFLLQALRSALNYFLPVEIRSIAALISFLAVVLPLVLFFIFFRKKLDYKIASGASASILLLLIAQLMVLSIMRRYPFGGEARQQSIIAPFLTLTGFLLLDWIMERFSNTWRAAAIIAAVILIATSFAYQWNKFRKVREELFTRQYDAFRAQLPPAQAVYVDQYSLIAYYIHTHWWKWTFERHLFDPPSIDEYQTTSPAGDHVVVCED